MQRSAVGSLIPPLAFNVPIADPQTGYPTPMFQRLMQRLALTADLTDTNGNIGIADGAITNVKIANGAVTYSKMQNISASQRVLGRNSAGPGTTEEVTLSQLLDWVGAAARGDVLYRGASGWSRLPAGTDGQVLTTHGTSADPTWADGGKGILPVVTGTVPPELISDEFGNLIYVEVF